MNFKGQVFVVLTGDCTVDEDGCVSSPGYDSGAYGNNERCRIAVNAAVATPLRVENFSTEVCWGLGCHIAGYLQLKKWDHHPQRPLYIIYIH